MQVSFRLLHSPPPPAEMYRGSLTPSLGGDASLLGPRWPAAQVLLYDTSWRAVIAVEGEDARKWLNGMVTANVRDLAQGRVAPSFQLDPKGHILASFDIACVGERRFLLLVSEDQRAGLIDRLRKFVFLSKLAMEDRSEELASLCLRGPEWRRVWEQAGMPPVSGAAARSVQPLGWVADGFSSFSAADGDTAWTFLSAPGGIAQIEVLAPPSLLQAAWARLEPVAMVAGSAVWERDRIWSAVPRHGVDISEGELPQETGQYDRLDFTKGCYVGQEIVERIRARGAVHRHWVRVALHGAAAAGAEILAGDKAVGKLTSLVEGESGRIGLGYIREPHHAVGTQVAVGGTAATVEAVIESRS